MSTTRTIPEFDKVAITHAITGGGSVTVGKFTFTMISEPDDTSYADNEDPAVFGRIEWTSHNRTSGRAQRPADFSGDSLILNVDYPHTCWYEFPPDLRSRKAGGFPSEEEWKIARDVHLSYVRDIVRYGYRYIVVKAIHETEDGYHKEWDMAIGGVEWECDSAYEQELVSDLVADVIASIERKS